MSDKPEKRYLLLVRPQGVGPPHWPRTLPSPSAVTFGGDDVIAYKWAVILPGGQHVTAIDRETDAVPESTIEELLHEWWDADEALDNPWPWEFQLVMLKDG